MAKKRASRSEFNMAEEIRTLLKANPKLKGREVVEALNAKFPNQKINAASASVAFSSARRKLGLRGKRKVVRVRKPGAAAPTRMPGVNFDILQAARKLIAEAGNAESAMAAVKQVASLQL